MAARGGKTPYRRGTPPREGDAGMRPMNLVVIVADTLRADHLGCYGGVVDTPNLDALAARGIRFTQAYAEALPTVCARRVFMTGRRLFPGWQVRRHKGDPLSSQPGWHALDDDDVTLSEVLQAAGYTTALVTDLYHLFKPGRNFHRGFDAWHWIRGQEEDRYRTGPRGAVDLTPYFHPNTYRRTRLRGLEQYLLNVADRRGEADYLAARVMRTAADWLRDNRDNQPFLLWVDAFDPHEPWDPPAAYADRYAPPVDGLEPIAPLTQSAAYRPEELARIRALYAGEVTLLDRWIGHLLQTLEANGQADDTIVAFLSDHGTLLGEHGTLRKQHHLLIGAETRIPWILVDPRDARRGLALDGLVQAEDVMATLLAALGIPPDRPLDGQDARSLAEPGTVLHPYAVTAYGDFACLRTEAWSYISAYRPPRQPRPELPLLFDLCRDPDETINVAADHPDRAAELATHLQRCLDAGDGARPGGLRP